MISKRKSRIETGGDEFGIKRLVSEMILGAIADLAALRRNGMWFDDPAEVALNLRTAQQDKNHGDPGRLLMCQGALVDVGVTSHQYLDGLCAVGYTALGMTFERGQLIAAAVTHDETCNYVRRHRMRRRKAGVFREKV
jgi:hypothetical protein